jgi:predicted enzyme related to lactoylglutathione lyase
VINFQPVPEEKVGKTRMHLDIWVDDLDAAISLVQQLGGKNTGEVHKNAEWMVVVMADPEGNEFCLVALPAP